MISRHDISITTLCALLVALGIAGIAAAEPDHAAAERAANTVILDESAVRSLQIETVEAEEADFEKTIFALGRIEVLPSKRAVVSSRISGRVIEIKANVGEMVEAGADVARIESRQPGDPPPSIVLKAPISGLVTRGDSRLGEPVEPDKPLLEITDLSEVFAVARVPEHLAGQLKPGALAHIRVAALPDEKFQGELLRFGTAADKASGTIDAVFRLPNPSLTLRPDMRAEFSIVLGKREGVMAIPRIALQGDALSRFVYVKDFELKNAFVKSPVVVGEMNDRVAEITSGLLPGDEVVTRGAYSLAFAGKGTMSLKEALDAAHGHEHAEDGSELPHAHKHNDADHDHDHDHDADGPISTLTIFSLITNGLLLVLLVVAMIRKKPHDEELPPASTSTSETSAEIH